MKKPRELDHKNEIERRSAHEMIYLNVHSIFCEHYQTKRRRKGLNNIFFHQNEREK